MSGGGCCHLPVLAGQLGAGEWRLRVDVVMVEVAQGGDEDEPGAGAGGRERRGQLGGGRWGTPKLAQLGAKSCVKMLQTCPERAQNSLKTPQN